MQKKEDKNDTVHHKATEDQKMCPIPAGAELKRRIRSYPNATGNTPILTLLIGSKNQSLFLFFHLNDYCCGWSLFLVVTAACYDVWESSFSHTFHLFFSPLLGCIHCQFPVLIEEKIVLWIGSLLVFCLDPRMLTCVQSCVNSAARWWSEKFWFSHWAWDIINSCITMLVAHLFPSSPLVATHLPSRRNLGRYKLEG